MHHVTNVKGWSTLKSCELATLRNLVIRHSQYY